MNRINTKKPYPTTPETGSIVLMLIPMLAILLGIKDKIRTIGKLGRILEKLEKQTTSVNQNENNMKMPMWLI